MIAYLGFGKVQQNRAGYKTHPKIDCYLSPNCASGETLRKNIYRALELEEIEAEVTFSVVDETEAIRLSLKGSPSILINGTDIQPVETPGFA